MQNNKITTTNLDFESIKLNLKQFLQGQSTFSDYDFEGAGLSILLDVLAYNTHYNALYTNLAVNESFLDSASKRGSVVSLAKSLGYVPDSARCSTATVTLRVTNTTSSPTTLTLPRFSAFGTVVDGVAYNFYTTEDVTVVKNGTQYLFENLEIKEGTPLSYRYQVSDGARYVIPNNNVDLTTLNARIQQSAGSSLFESFTRNENILELNEKSAVFFVKEIEGELYELEFGNGVVGKAVLPGNVINLEYMICNKELPNGARVFTYEGPSLLGGVVDAITVLPAQLGTDKEGIDTVRYNAPRAYSTQNRAVTVNDYKNIILSQYAEAESVNVWGGEDNIPPVYGRVFVSIKPKTTNTLSAVQKDYIVNTILKPRNVVSISPVIVDPEYIDLEVTTSIYYNPKATSKGTSDLKDMILSTIVDFADTNLDSYDGVFRFSKFTSAIDATEPSIVSNITTIKLHRQVEPKYNVYAQYNIELGNPIYNSGVQENSILSSGFYVPEYDFVVYLEDLPTDTAVGQFRMFYYDINLDKQYLKTLGSINYAAGSLTLPNLNIIGLDSSAFEFVIKPQSNDVISIRNQLVRIPQDTITINVIVDKISSGDAAGNANYTFTSSRT